MPMISIGKRDDSLKIAQLDMDKVSELDELTVVHRLSLTDRIPRKSSGGSVDDGQDADDFKELLMSSGLLFNRAKDKAQSFKVRRP